MQYVFDAILSPHVDHVLSGLVSKRTENIFWQSRTYWLNGVEEINTGGVYFLILI